MPGRHGASGHEREYVRLGRLPQVDALEDRARLRGAGAQQREGGAEDLVLGERVHRVDDRGVDWRGGN